MTDTIQDMKSKLELQIEAGDTVRVGDVILYFDAENYEHFRVKELFEGGFLVSNDSTEKDLWYGKIQHGWELVR